MADLVIIIADSREAVIATAQARQVQIDPKKIRAFESLTTTYGPGFPNSGKVNASQQGFVVIGNAV